VDENIFNIRVIGKILQIIGVIIAFTGLIGDQRLKSWEIKIRGKVRFLLDTSRIRRIVERIRNLLERLLNWFIGVHWIIVPIGLFIIAIPILIIEIRFTEYLFSTSWCIVIMFVLAVWALLFWTFIVIENTHLSKSRIKVNERIGILLISPIVYLFYVERVVAFIFTCAIVGVLLIIIALILGLGVIFLSFLLLILWIALLPYLILDRLTIRFKMKSTVLLVGLVLELIGLVLS
jgi:hypothetical protein